jgi:hypothetical protein
MGIMTMDMIDGEYYSISQICKKLDISIATLNTYSCNFQLTKFCRYDYDSKRMKIRWCKEFLSILGRLYFSKLKRRVQSEKFKKILEEYEVKDYGYATA